MPDPSVSAALAEAYAIAPSDEVILHTLELRHPLFVDEEGNPDSIWVVRDRADLVATIEADAPIRGGEEITFVAFAFNFRLPQVENAPTPEIEVSIDNIDRRIVENLDAAVADTNKIVICYRPFLSSDTSAPQMDPPLTLTLTEVKVDSFSARGKARLDLDLSSSFPRRLYTAAEFPGLIGL